MTTATSASAKPHRFAHLAAPPYVFRGMEEKVHHVQGEYARAAGTCDHCSTCIRWAFKFRGSDGREFVLGCDCATHTDDGGKAEDAVAREVRYAKRELDRQLRAPKIEAKRLAKISKERAEKEAVRELLAAEPVRVALSALPHPHPGLAQSGKTRLDWAEYINDVYGAPAKVRAFVGTLDFAAA